jgi:hypothetical protein
MATNFKIDDGKDLIKNPTLKAVIFFTGLWLTTVVGTIAVITDLFTESIINKKYFLQYFMILIATWTVVRVYRNYFKNKKVVQ